MAVTRLDGGGMTAIIVAGRMIVLGREEANSVMNEIAGVQACWLDPAPRQLWAAVCRVLGLDGQLPQEFQLITPPGAADVGPTVQIFTP